MQPYFFPYVGYFQLIAKVDKFIFYDDVNYIKNGWINRNRLFISGAVQYITIPLNGASPFVKINEVLVLEQERWKKKMLDSVRFSYSRAPYFKPVFELLRDVVISGSKSISEIAKSSVKSVSDYAGLDVEFVDSSSRYNNSDLSGAERILDICIKENAGSYCNLPGGKALYSGDAFSDRGVALEFLETELRPYRQFSDKFVQGLSILDILMFNDRCEVFEMVSAGRCSQADAV